MRGPIDLPKSPPTGCISRTVGVLACTSGPESMRSPQQSFEAVQAWRASQAHSIHRKPGDSMAGSSPGKSLTVCFGFADILALTGDKTIHESWEAALLVQGGTVAMVLRMHSRRLEKVRYTSAILRANVIPAGQRAAICFFIHHPRAQCQFT